MPTEEWLRKYEAARSSLGCETDLDAYFTEDAVGGVAVDVMKIGDVRFPTGGVVACDPLVELGEAHPYVQQISAGTYPVSICVVPNELYGDRYACVKVSCGEGRPVRYEMGLVGNEDLDEELGEDEFFGFFVDAGMGCIADAAAQEAFKGYWERRVAEEEDIDPYNDLFYELLEQNAQANPKYQKDGGDWLNWTVPGTDCDIALFASGWGDGAYPCYFGYDAAGEVCGVYIRFIDIEKEFAE